MFAQVPAHVWLLIAIAVLAYAPARYVYRYIVHSPSRRDITQPSPDLSWRTSGQLVRYLLTLAALIGLAVFILTPAATTFAHSPRFWPILMLAAGMWALLTIPRGLATGKIQPFIRGNYNTYQREVAPRRFWASVGWNALFGCLCVGLAFMMNKQEFARPAQDRCYNEPHEYSPKEALSACTELINNKARLGGWRLADAFVGRGIAYADLNDNKHALADYTAALRLQPDYFEAYFNRALAYRALGESERAIADFDTAIRLQPNDSDAFLNRGLIFLDSMKLDQAVADFTRAHELDPKSPWPLADRGMSYAWKSDGARAEKDFQAVRAIDPSNQVVFRGEALLSMESGDLETAIDRLNAQLIRDPTDAGSLRMRSDAYQQLGDFEKAQVDRDTLLRLIRRTSERGLPPRS